MLDWLAREPGELLVQLRGTSSMRFEVSVARLHTLSLAVGSAFDLDVQGVVMFWNASGVSQCESLWRCE